MKKLLLILTLLFVATFAFAEPVDELEQILNTFISDSKYIIYYESSSINYIPITSIFKININNERLEILTNAFDEENAEFIKFQLKRYDITQDDKGNIIIKPKK